MKNHYFEYLNDQKILELRSQKGIQTSTKKYNSLQTISIYSRAKVLLII